MGMVYNIMCHTGMGMSMVQNVALDSNVVISMMDDRKWASQLRSRLKGKPVRIIICDVVLREVGRVRGYLEAEIRAAVCRLLGKKDVRVVPSTDESIRQARELTDRFATCHNGDNKILSLCRAENLVLLTADHGLLRACGVFGVAAFHPNRAANI